MMLTPRHRVICLAEVESPAQGVALATTLHLGQLYATNASQASQTWTRVLLQRVCLAWQAHTVGLQALVVRRVPLA